MEPLLSKTEAETSGTAVFGPSLVVDQADAHHFDGVRPSMGETKLVEELSKDLAVERILLFSLGMPLRSMAQPRFLWYGMVALSGLGLIGSTCYIIFFVTTDTTGNYSTFKQFLEITTMLSVCYLAGLAFTGHVFFFSRRQLYRADSDAVNSMTIKRAMSEYRNYLRGYLIVAIFGVLLVMGTDLFLKNSNERDSGLLLGLAVLNLVGNSPIDAFVVLLSVITQQQVDSIRLLRVLAEKHELTREAYLERQALISRTSERWSRPLSLAVGSSHVALGIFLIMICLLIDVSYPYACVAAGVFLALFSKWLILSLTLIPLVARVNNENDLLAAAVTNTRWSDPNEQAVVYMTLSAHPISFEVGGERMTAGYLRSKIFFIFGLVA